MRRMGLPLSLSLDTKQKGLSALSDAASWNRHLSVSSVTARALLLPRLSRARVRGLPPSQLGVLAWRALRLSWSFDGAWGWPTLRPTRGALNVTGSWTNSPYMQAPVLLVGSALSGTTRCATFWLPGPTAPASKPRLRNPASCCHSDRMSLAQRRPADIFLPSLSGGPAALDLAVTAPQAGPLRGPGSKPRPCRAPPPRGSLCQGWGPVSPACGLLRLHASCLPCGLPPDCCLAVLLSLVDPSTLPLFSVLRRRVPLSWLPVLTRSIPARAARVTRVYIAMGRPRSGLTPKAPFSDPP